MHDAFMELSKPVTRSLHSSSHKLNFIDFNKAKVIFISWGTCLTCIEQAIYAQLNPKGWNTLKSKCLDIDKRWISSFFQICNKLPWTSSWQNLPWWQTGANSWASLQLHWFIPAQVLSLNLGGCRAHIHDLLLPLSWHREMVEMKVAQIKILSLK